MKGLSLDLMIVIICVLNAVAAYEGSNTHALEGWTVGVLAFIRCFWIKFG